LALALALLLPLLASCGDDLETSDTCEHGDQQRASADAPPTTARPEQAAPAQRAFQPVYCLDLADPFVLTVDRLVNDRRFVFGTTVPLYHVPVLIPEGLVRAEKIEDALPEPPSWAAQGGGWAPSVLARGEDFILYYTIKDAASGRQCISMAVSRDAEGPYTDSSKGPLVCPLDLGGAIDPSPFTAADGTTYLTWKNDGNCCGIPTRIWSQPLADDGRSFVGQPAELLRADQGWEGGIVEAPSMLVADGAYYLFYSANSWSSSAYGIGYATCQGPSGPCTKPLDRPWLGSSSDAAGPGGAEVFSDGDQVRMVFHAWIDGKVGYEQGGHRSLFTTAITIRDGAPVAG
jgi:hypothetical protein